MQHFSQVRNLIITLIVLCAGSGYFFSQFSLQASKEASSITGENIAAQIFKLPLYFEKNEGQTHPQIKYLSKGYGASIYFTPQEMMLVPKGISDSKELDLIKMQFIGAKSDPMILGLEEQASKSHYFIGSDPQGWRTNIPHYGKIAYQDLYPGIDALFYGHNGQLEYDLIVSPGCNPETIRLQIEGVKELSLDENGNLHLLVKDQQEVIMQKPFVYQNDGQDRTPIEGEFTLLAHNEIGFVLGSYDIEKALVIDPILSYSTYLGSSGTNQGVGIAVDSSGSAYVTGITDSTNFPTISGAFQTLFVGGSSDAFITKLNPAGSSLIYSTYLGGSNTDQGRGIVVDSSGNAYVTGITQSTNFPTTSGAFQTLYGGSFSNAFIAKLNSAGSMLTYSTYLGGSREDLGFGIALDSSGSAYVTGYTTSTNFPTTSGAFQTLFSGVSDVFIAKLSPDGSMLSYSTYVGNSDDNEGRGIAVDSSGSAYVTGITSSGNFPITSGAFQTLFSGVSDAFITKLNSAGSMLIYSTYLGGSNDVNGFGIAVDSSGSAYVTGETTSADFPTTLGAFQTLYGGVSDAFITKLNPDGSMLSYSTYLGGSNDDLGLGIAVDNSGSAYVTGNTSSLDFPTTSGAFQTSFGGGLFDAFITKLNPDGSMLSYSTYLGGSDFDFGVGIAVDNSGSAYVTGSTSSLDFPTTSGAFQTSFGGGFFDAFITKLAIGTPVITSISPSCGPTSGGTVVTITGSNFTDPASVTFGGVPALSVMVDSDTQITASSPPHSAGTVDIIVQTSAGSSSPSITDAFTYTVPPVISSVSPNNGTTSGGTAVTITGSNFTGATVVNFGLTPATSFNVDSATQITATSPAHAAGVVDITVVTPCGGTSAISPNDQFTYQVPPQQLIPTTTTLIVTPNPAKRNQLVTLTASISSPEATGSAVFYGNNKLLGVAPVVNGQAVLTTSFSEHGELFIIAAYSGDNTFEGSVSNVIILNVGKPEDLQPPRKLFGFKKRLGFHVINILEWNAPESHHAIIAYHIFRDRLDNQIGTVTNLQHLQFKDEHMKAGKTYTYYVVSVDELGAISEAAQVVIAGIEK